MKKLLMSLALVTLVSCGVKNNSEGNRVEFSNNSYYVYYDSEVLEIPSGSYITSDKKIDDYFFDFFGKHVKDGKKLTGDLSKYFPHGIMFVEKSDKKPENYVALPIMKIGDKEVVDSIRLATILAGGDGEALINIDDSSEIVQVKNSKELDPDVSLAGKTVEVLNANGINGFAKNLGEAFSKNLEMKYNAENYKERSNLSYVINHKLSEAEFNKFVNSISLKYIKVREDQNLKPDSDVVIITGNDNNVNYPVYIYAKDGETELKDLLSEYKPIIKNQETSDEKTEGVIVKYNKEDVVIARKILSYIPTAKLVEDNNIKDELVIVTNR